MKRVALVAALALLCGCPPEGSGGRDASTKRRDAAGLADAQPVPGADAEALPEEDAGEPPDAEGGRDAARRDAGLRDAGSSPGPDASVPGDPDAGSCTVPVPAPDVNAFYVRAPSLGVGGIVTQSPGGHQDVYLLSPSPADLTRIGVRLDWGGAIFFYGLSADPNSNVIDAESSGRALQFALHDPARSRQGCSLDASCLTSSIDCGDSSTYLGWSPVQGGDECGRGAQASYFIMGDTLRIQVKPVQSNPDWPALDCRDTACSGAATEAGVEYTMDLRYVDPHVVEVGMEAHIEEIFDHALANQEFPTLYASHGVGGPDLSRLLDAGGSLVAIDQPAGDRFTKDFTSPAGWVSFQDASSSYGVGLATDQGLRGFQGWSGDGTSAPYFHNVRAQLAFGMKAASVARSIAYVALGDFATVKSSLESVLAKRPPFGYVDQPAKNTIGKGANVLVDGWVLDNTPVGEVDVEIDGAIAATLPVDGSRAGVCVEFPGYAACPNVGYAGWVSTAALDECPHLLRVSATDADGNRTVLGERLIQR